jgi:hypothetical protein
MFWVMPQRLPLIMGCGEGDVDGAIIENLPSHQTHKLVDVLFQKLGQPWRRDRR